jgi:hypothetical protein
MWTMSHLIDMGGGREQGMKSSPPPPELRAGAAWAEACDRIARRHGLSSALPLGALPELARAMALAPAASIEAAEAALEAILRRHAPVAPPAASPAADDTARAVAGMCHTAIADELSVAGRES